MTRFSTILAFVLFITSDNGRYRVSFSNLRTIIPDHRDELNIAFSLGSDMYFRFVKRHLNCTPEYKLAIYLVRNAVDVSKGYYRYVVNSYGYKGAFSDFIRHKSWGYKAGLIT